MVTPPKNKNMTKKILFIFPSFNIGGVEKMLAFVANSCANHGYDSHAINIYPGEQTIYLDDRIKKEFVHLNIKSSGWKLIVNKIKFLLSMRKKIKQICPDLIVVFQTDITKAVIYACRGLNIPVISSERNDPTCFSGSRLEKYRAAYNKCDAVVYQLEGAKEYLKAGKKQVVIPNPAIPRLQNLEGVSRKELGINIIAAGRFTLQKNFDLLIDAFEKALPKLGDSKLIIYGDGPLRDHFCELISQKGLEQKILLPGNVKNFVEERDGGGVFVLSSNREGIPNALMEAMMAGYACISTDCKPGGPAWLSDNGRRVKIVPMNDVDSLSNAIVELSTNMATRDELAKNALEIVDICAPHKIEDLWIKLIKEVLDKNSN